MERQLHLFQPGDNCSVIWQRLPEEVRQKIETIFSELIVEHLSSRSEEIENHEK